MKAIKQILDWVNQYWGALAILGTSLGAVVTFIHLNIVMPVIDEHIDNRAVKVVRDTTPHIIDEHMIKKGGFRGAFSQETGIPKDSVAIALGILYNREKDKDELIKENDSLRALINHNNGVIKLLIEETFSKYEAINGAFIWYSPLGNPYYFDYYRRFNYLWDASPKSDGYFYFYPSYFNNDRKVCK